MVDAGIRNQHQGPQGSFLLANDSFSISLILSITVIDFYSVKINGAA